MAISQTQAAVPFDTGFTGGTTASATYGSALTSGTKLIAWFACDSSVTITCSDPTNGSWTAINNRFWANVGDSLYMFAVDNTATSAVTVTFAWGGSSRILRNGGIYEWSGLASGAVNAISAGNNSAGTTVTDTNVTPSVNGCLIFSCAAMEQVPSTGSGFTTGNMNLSSNCGAEYQVQATAAAIAPTFGQAPTGQALLVSAAFAPSGGGGPTLPPIIVMPPRRP